jgi:drug/metabolite transporter (DMT)-like permease
VASALSTFGNVYLKRHSHCDPLRTFAPAMLLSGTAVTIAGAFTTPIDFSRALARPPILATLYLAIFGSSITFYLNHWLRRHLTAWMVGLQALIIPVIAVIALGPSRDASRATMVAAECRSDAAYGVTRGQSR